MQKNMFELKILLICIINFIVIFFLHILVKRNYKKNEDLISITNWSVCTLIILIVEYSFDYINLIMNITCLISLSWVLSFPAIYAASPTLIIILLIEKKVNSYQKIIEIYDVEKNSQKRIDDSIDFGFVKRDFKDLNILKLTRFGVVFIFIMSWIKKLHALDKVETL